MSRARFAITCLALAAQASALAQDANLLRNPGFEDSAGDRPADWAFENWQMGGLCRIETDGPHTGQRCISVTCASAKDRGAWRQIVPFQGPGYVHFSAWYRTSFDALATADISGPVVRFLFFRDAGKWDHPSIPWFSAPPSRDWARFTKVLPVSAEITSIGIELFNISTEGTVWWDDAMLRPATDDEAAEALREQYAAIDRDPDVGETGYAPEDGSEAPTNPPTFVWLPLERAQRYRLQWSKDPGFAPETTETAECTQTIHAPRSTFAPGVWYWRFGVEAPAPAGMVYSKARRFTVSDAAPEVPFPDVAAVVRKLSGVRPRDFMPSGGIDALRDLAQGELKEQAQALRRDAERYIDGELLPEPPRLPPPGDPRYGEEYVRIFQATRRFNAGMVACAQAYLLTGDERCGQEARRRLMHLMSWDPEGSTSLFHHDEPGTELVRVCPRTYDWIYPLLSEDERRKCREVLAARIPQLYKALTDMHFETRPYSSHPMDYYISDLTEACLTMAGELPVEEMLQYVLTQLWSPFYPPFGGPEGGWCEGPSYWQWSTASFLRTFHLVRQATGCDLFRKPWLANTPYFKLYCNPPYSRMSPFGDGQSGAAGGGDTMYKLGAALRDPYALWFAEQQHQQAGGIEQFLFRREGLEARAPSDLPQARCFADVGLACMHSDLADGANNVQFMMRSSPFGAISHAYADQNAFVLHAYGEPLAIASGYYPYYASPHHAQWTWLTKAANSILVNGEGQKIRDWRSKGRIAQFATNGYCHYALGDAHLAYPGVLSRFDRHALFLRPQTPDEEPVVVLMDDLEASKPSSFQWLLHALDEMQIDETGQRVTIGRGAARLRVSFLCPAGLRLSQADQFTVPPERDGMPNQWHLTASADEPVSARHFLTVLQPYREGQQPATARAIEVPGALGVEVRGASLTHTVVFRTDAARGTPLSVAGTQTDADVFAVATGAEQQGPRAVFSLNWDT